jgi:hypothetical protein
MQFVKEGDDLWALMGMEASIVLPALPALETQEILASLLIAEVLQNVGGVLLAVLLEEYHFLWALPHFPGYYNY